MLKPLVLPRPDPPDFSGAASASLHGWEWIAMAVLGTLAGVRLRPLFGLRN